MAAWRAERYSSADTAFWIFLAYSSIHRQVRNWRLLKQSNTYFVKYDNLLKCRSSILIFQMLCSQKQHISLICSDVEGLLHKCSIMYIMPTLLQNLPIKLVFVTCNVRWWMLLFCYRCLPIQKGISFQWRFSTDPAISLWLPLQLESSSLCCW